MSDAPRFGLLRSLSLIGLWLATAGLMARDYAADPPDLALVGTRAYGHNHEGALVQGLVFSAIELLALLALLRPWSYDRAWGRALVTLLLLAPWTLFSMMMTMHAGGVFVLHFLWLALVCVLVFLGLVWSLIAAARR